MVLVVGCTAEPGLTSGQKQALEKRNAELATKHNDIWDLMGLSKAAKDELNGVVARINTQMTENRARKPEEYDKVFKESKRKENITHETYVADHVKRWQTLKLSVVGKGLKTHEPHVHAEDEFFFVLEGQAEFILAGEKRTVGPWTSLYCPPNVEHGIRNAGDGELKYLVVKKYKTT